MNPDNAIPFEFTCPHCGEQMDAAANSHDRQVPPGPGNFWLCGACGNPGRFENGAFGLLARALYPQEADELPPDLIMVALAIQQRRHDGTLWDKEG